LPDSATNIEQYRLPIEALEELGQNVTRLRDQADERASLIDYQGDAADAPRQPPKRSQRELKEQSKLRIVKHLAKEEAHIERYERQLSGKYQKRRYNELTAADITAIQHAVLIQHRFHRDIAEQYQVSVGLVGRIGRKVGTEHIEFKIQKEEKASDDHRRVRAVCFELLERHGAIQSVA